MLNQIKVQELADAIYYYCGKFGDMDKIVEMSGKLREEVEFLMSDAEAKWNEADGEKQANKVCKKLAIQLLA